MKRVFPDQSWPDSWKYSYPYDLQEIYSEPTHLGYSYAYATRKKETIELITEVLAPGAPILDIAGAQGNFSLLLAELGYEVTWNDLRADLEGYVRLKHERGTLHFAPGSAFELTFPSKFDAVLMTEVIEHVAHPDHFLTNASRLVRPGGYIIMTTPNGKYFRNTLPKFTECADPSKYEVLQFKPNSDGHIFLLHPDEIYLLAKKAGLEVEKMSLHTSPLTIGHMKLGRLLPFVPRAAILMLEVLFRKLPPFIARQLLTGMAVRFKVFT